jgi:sec-independent protein translocase protein TatA
MTKGVFMGRMPELILILAIFILLFGAQKLPEVGAALGRAIREFKKNMRETEEEIKKPIESESSLSDFKFFSSIFFQTHRRIALAVDQIRGRFCSCLLPLL